jgi:hypothetical protein
LPHSEIRGSKVVRTSPRLIAAYHVLHRLLPPRHPSNALKSLDCSHYQCPLGSGFIDAEKTRSCEINPIAARFVLLALRRSRVEPQAYPFFTMVRSQIDERAKALLVKLCSQLFATREDSIGGARRDRTDDLKLAKLALSQLSYGPKPRHPAPASSKAGMVGLGRVELPTSRLSGVRSNHLSYRPAVAWYHSALLCAKRRKRNEDGEVPQMPRYGYIGLISNENLKHWASPIS